MLTLMIFISISRSAESLGIPLSEAIIFSFTLKYSILENDFFCPEKLWRILKNFDKFSNKFPEILIKFDEFKVCVV